MPLVWLRCRDCGVGLFLAEGQKAFCGTCVRTAVLHLDWVFRLAALNTPRPGVVRRVNLLPR